MTHALKNPSLKVAPNTPRKGTLVRERGPSPRTSGYGVWTPQPPLLRVFFEINTVLIMLMFLYFPPPSGSESEARSGELLGA